MPPRYATGDNIPQVAIQPSANPISLNVLPAAGQPIRGANDLIQIAEALAPFNQGLLAFGKRAVDAENERASIAGASLDMGQVQAGNVPIEQRAAELNRQFRSVVEKSGVSDAANPFFQIAARQNLGRKLAFDYRAAMYARREQVTDPDNPLSYQDASAQVAQEVLGDALVGDFYGFAGFREVAQKVDAELMNEFAVESIRRKESKGALFAKQALTQAIQQGDLETANVAFADYQLKVTDPVKVRATFVGAAKDILMSSRDVEEMTTRLDRLKSVQYGNQSVDKNMDLVSELVQFEDQARRTILARIEQETRVGEMAFDSAKREMFGQGFVSEAYRHIQTKGAEIAGGSLADWASVYVDDLAQKKGWSPAVSERVKEYAIERAQALVARTEAMSSAKSADIRKTLYAGVLDNSLPTEESVIDAAQALGADPDTITAVLDFRTKRSGPVQAAINQTLEEFLNQNSGVFGSHFNGNGLFPYGLDGRPTARGALEANRHAMRAGTELRLAADQFSADMIPDKQGKFFSEYANQGQQQAAAAMRRFMADKNSEIVNNVLDESDRAVTAGKVSMGGSFIKREEDPAAVNWKSWESLGQVVSNVSSGKEVVSDRMLPEQAAAIFRDNSDRLAKDYDIGVMLGTRGSHEQLRVAVAERLFTAMAQGGDVETKDRDVIGGISFGLAFIVPAITEGAIGSTWPRAAYDYWSTFKNVDQIREDYATVMRMGGLTLDHILVDRDQEGLPVFGLTVPKTKEEAMKAAFAIPMIQSIDELTDVGKVSAVLKRLGLTDNEMPQFIKAQTILHQIRSAASKRFDDPAWMSVTTPEQLQQSKSAYLQSLESAKQKIGQ